MFLTKNIDSYFTYLVQPDLNNPKEFISGRISAYSIDQAKLLLKSKYKLTDNKQFYMIKPLTINLKKEN